LNLITNAFYAVNEKAKSDIEGYQPTVTVSSKLTPLLGGAGGGSQVVKIAISDNGNGMPQEIVEKIFQPFFTTKPTGQGTGLGLSMSYDIVTKGHGGELLVETEEGEGSTFSIELPTKQ
jgi:signal transduction histidine kinase